MLDRLNSTMLSVVSHSHPLVSTQEAEPPISSAVCNGDLDPNRGEHVRPTAACTELLIAG